MVDLSADDHAFIQRCRTVGFAAAWREARGEPDPEPREAAPAQPTAEEIDHGP